MKPLPILVAAVAVSALTAYATQRLSPGAVAASSADSHAAPQLEQILSQLEGLTQRTATLESKLEPMLSAGSANTEVVRPLTTQRVSASAIEEAVAQWMVEHAPNASGLSPEDSEALAAASPPAGVSAAQRADLMARLTSGELSGGEFDKLWYELRDAGLADEAIAALEQRAAEYPGDVQAQLDLGMGYVYELGEVSSGPEKGKLAMQADGAFDQALELDPENWNARFYKAVSLSHWPAFLGKQAEAITNFEVLIGQQEGSTPKNSHAQTYVYLGNLYREAGEFDKAKATWQAGLALFPQDEALAEQLAAHQ